MAVVTSHSLNPEKGPYNKNNTKIIPTVPSENNTVKIVVTLFPFLDFLFIFLLFFLPNRFEKYR